MSFRGLPGPGFLAENAGQIFFLPGRILTFGHRKTEAGRVAREGLQPKTRPCSGGFTTQNASLLVRVSDPKRCVRKSLICTRG